MKKLFKNFNIEKEKLFDLSEKNPGIFILLIMSAEEEILKRNASYFMLKLIKAFTDPDFSYYKEQIIQIWESKALATILEASSEDIDLIIQAIEERKDQKNFPYFALRSKIDIFYHSLFEKKTSEILCTKKSFIQKQQDLQKIIKEIPQVRLQIKQAKEFKDLRENFEYKAARERYAYLQSIASKLSDEFERVRVIKKEEVNLKITGFGTKVTLKSIYDVKIVQILGIWESNPAQDIYSIEAEGISGLLGKGVGEMVEFFGKTYRIESIELSDLFDE